MATGWGLFALGFPACHYPASIPVKLNVPTMPSADSCHTVKEDCSPFSLAISRKRLAMAVWQVSRGKTHNSQCVDARFIKHDPLRMEDFAVTCQLVPVIPHLESGSCTSPRIFGLGFLQTPSRDDALALLLAFGSAKTWRRDSHPASYGPCPAHT